MGFKIKKTVNGETVWEPIKAKKYTTSKITEYTGSLPITISANGDALLDYRIYGTDGGVGERVDITGLSEPLCGTQTHTDRLDLSTGILTRKIKKLVLTGDESWLIHADTYYISVNNYYRMYDVGRHLSVCSHCPIVQLLILPEMHYGLGGLIDGSSSTRWNGNIVFNPSPMISSMRDWKSYLAAQYAAGTPVTVWYVLNEPDVSTISIPPALAGTIEGYLIQDGTPTPETPIYPTANGVKQADGTYSIPYGYKLPMTVGNGDTAQTVPVYIGENQLDAGEYVSYGEQKIYRDVGGTLTPTDPPVPLPEIPTIKGETIIDYDGDPKPSQMYVKYNSWSGWSDIDNYKMVNGDWTQGVT